MPEPSPPAELRIPHSGEAVAVTIGYLIGLALVSVAVGNLIYANRVSVIAIIASILWLAFMGFVICAMIQDEGGVRRYIKNRIGVYSRRHFVRATLNESKANSISIGYTISGCDFICLIIRTDDISSVCWNSGQGTSLAGRDMNDWNVVLWYYDPQKPPSKRIYPGMREEELIILGRTGPREEVEKFGMQLVEFLIHNGVDLTPGKDNCQYITPRRRKDDEHAKLSENLTC